ncbi:ABC transporter permease [Nonomuraea fuscirosea]|uniref:Transport permease protein n=1 Tax=Nonomuraea fuscirosea TaxID=1291556 RepID=A0A2T0MZT0_9ACTN|nr:ABC transporter permease [Nonomuraea fuscirosea]PRX64883.1 ABC-type polysaccharide/polyol phosphate export permease [Nonomuraea fuscirosea]
MTAPSLVRATRVIGARNVLRLRRSPDLIAVVAVQPVLFVLLFGFVLGGAIQVPAGDYQAFLVTGVLVQTVVFGSALAGIGMAEDLERGVVDRFRSLPVPRASIVIARVLSQQITGALGISVTAGCGLLLQWRPHGGLAGSLAAFGLLMLFGLAMSLVSVTIGCAVRSTEAAQVACYAWLFPVTFVSDAFVPTDRMAMPVRLIAEWNPMSAVTTTVRALLGDGAPAAGGWPQEHAPMLALGWCAVLIAAFLPWSVHVYQRRTAGRSRPTSAGRAKGGAGHGRCARR